MPAVYDAPMKARDALIITRRAERKGWSPERIADRLHCTTAAFRYWGRKPDANVGGAIAANLTALLAELRGKGGK